MADRYLLESGAPDGYLLEDGSGVLLLDAPASVTFFGDTNQPTQPAKIRAGVWCSADCVQHGLAPVRKCVSLYALAGEFVLAPAGGPGHLYLVPQGARTFCAGGFQPGCAAGNAGDALFVVVRPRPVDHCVCLAGLPADPAY